MYSKQALHELGVTHADFTSDQQRQLDEAGFYIIQDVLSPGECEGMAEEFERLHAQERDTGGSEVHVEPGARRVSNIFNKTAIYDRCLELRPLLAASHYLLGEFKLHGANLRDPEQGFGHQQLHVDVPKRFDGDWWVLNAIVLFDDMTLTNGPTRVVPRSHHWPSINVPYVNQGDWEPTPLTPEQQAMVPTNLDAAYPGQVLVTAKAGSMVVINSSLWHAGTAKQDATARRVLHLTYTRRDLPQQLTQIDYLTPALWERMPPVHRWLLDIEPRATEVLRQPKRDHKGWWA